MKRVLIFIFIILLTSPAFAGKWRYSFKPILRYNMCPNCVDYDTAPVKKSVLVTKKAVVAKKVVATPVKAVKAVTRKIIGYKKVCGPNGCVMVPIYENNAVKSSPVRTYRMRRS